MAEEKTAIDTASSTLVLPESLSVSEHPGAGALAPISKNDSTEHTAEPPKSEATQVQEPLKSAAVETQTPLKSAATEIQENLKSKAAEVQELPKSEAVKMSVVPKPEAVGTHEVPTSEATRTQVSALLRSSWTGMVESLRGMWSRIAQRYFGQLVFPETRVKQVQDAAQEGTVVYVLRSRSYLNYLIYNALFLVYKLPLVGFAAGLFWVPWQTWTQKMRVFRDWFGRIVGRGGMAPDQLFRELVLHRVPTLIFLERPATLWTYVRRGLYWFRDMVRWIFRRPEAPGGRPIDLLEDLVHLQRRQTMPIFLCPQIMVWDQVPTSARKSFWDVVFGERESPGLLREIYQFLRNKKQSQVHGGEPINLKQFVSRYTEQLTDAEVASKLRMLLRERFDREFRVTTGPVFRSAEEMKERVLRAPRVRKTIRTYAEENNQPEEVIQQRARKILNRMAANFHMSTARIFDWFLHKVWKRMFTRHESDPKGMEGIDVLPDEIERVREAAIQHPLVLLPCHKSHVDYLIMSQILLHYDMVPPHIAAGDNLLIPIVGWIFRRSGAFFLRRSFGNDPLYRTIFNEYVLRLLREGYTLEFFIEGGRSRTGKLRPPKTGMLKLLVDAALEKRIRDFYLVPSSVTYDRIVEGESYSRELLGGQKKSESLGSLLRSARQFLSINFGRIVVRFAQPISIREAIDQQIEIEKEKNPTFDPVNNQDDRRDLIHALAYRVLYEINQASWIMASSLVIAILMTESRRGISHERMVQEVKWLRQEVEARGAKVYHFDEPDLVVHRATKSLNRLIKTRDFLDKGLMIYRARASRRLELAYYRNHILHLFVSEAVIACALQAFQWRRSTDRGVAKVDLLKEVRFLSQLLKKEFIYKPSPDIQDNLDETLALMERRNILQVNPNTQIVEPMPDSGLKMIGFLRHLFWPFIDSYWVASVALFALREEPMEEKAFHHKMQDIAESLYHEGYLRYSDVVSLETLTNALELYEELGVVMRVPMEEGSTRSSRKRQLALTETYRKHEELQFFVTRIGKFSSCTHLEEVIASLSTKLSGAPPK